MATHELTEGADNWCTPKWILDALGYEFDLDPCGDINDRVPAKQMLLSGGLSRPWEGSVWLNPPFGKYRYQIVPWLAKFVEHGNGIAIVPNRTATRWWQEWASHCGYLIFLEGKVKFIQDGKEGKSPGYGNVLGAMGDCTEILRKAKFEGLRVDKGE